MLSSTGLRLLSRRYLSQTCCHAFAAQSVLIGATRWLRTTVNLQVPKEICDVTPEMKKYLKCRKDSKLETCLVDEATVNPCWESPSVIIIGAGLAGLSAAQQLVSAGITDVTVLEATDRPGGRIHSCWIGETVAEIGALHIEGSSMSNSVTGLAAQKFLFEKPTARLSDSKLTSFTSEGQVVQSDIAMAADACFNVILKQAADLYGKCGPGVQCGSLCSFICSRIDQEIRQFPSNQRASAARVMISKQIDVASRLGADLSKVSACQFGAKAIEPVCPSQCVSFSTGLVQILAPLLTAMPRCDNIRYCKPAGKILWCSQPDSPRVKVFCCDGDMICGDYVIVTCSLGVLKEKFATMFEPKLSETKEKAISRLGYGYITNIYLEYERPFWLWNEGSLSLAWNHDLYMKKDEWTHAIGSIHEVPSSQQVLRVTLGGELAKDVESLPDVNIAEDLTRIFRRFLNDPTIPYPVNVVKSQWADSPYFAGATTYFGLESTPTDQCELLRPERDPCSGETPAVFFAGEATAVGLHGTLQGARASGLREAHRIIELTKKFQGKPRDLECQTVAETQ